LCDVHEIASQNTSEDRFMLVARGFDLIDFFLEVSVFGLHLLFLIFEAIEFLELSHQLIVYRNSLFHYWKSEFVLSAYPFPLANVSVIESNKKVDQRQKISLLCTDFLFSFENSQSLPGK